MNQESPSSLFVGLGRMGEPMVKNLARHRPVWVFDASPDAVARVAAETGIEPVESLDRLPESVDTVLLMLPTSRIVESVLSGSEGKPGLLEQLPSGALVIDLGSSEPASTRELAAAAADRGIDYVDAPVSGGVAKAASGELSIMVGGERNAVNRAMPLIASMGSQVVHVGPAGAGHSAKAINNLLSAANVAATAEALCAAQKAGIEPEKMLEVINNSTGRSQASEVKYPQHILTGSFRSGFAMDLMLKDIGIAMRLIQSLGVTAPSLTTASESAEDAPRALDGADFDHTELARYIEELNGSRLRYSAADAGTGPGAEQRRGEPDVDAEMIEPSVAVHQNGSGVSPNQSGVVQ